MLSAVWPRSTGQRCFAALNTTQVLEAQIRLQEFRQFHHTLREEGEAGGERARIHHAEGRADKNLPDDGDGFGEGGPVGGLAGPRAPTVEKEPERRQRAHHDHHTAQRFLEINAAGIAVFTGERGGEKLCNDSWENFVKRLKKETKRKKKRLTKKRS